MKTGLFIYKSNNTNVSFSLSDNVIVKTGIVRYFQEQKHNEYNRYFSVNNIDLINHFKHLKDSLFNSNDMVLSRRNVQQSIPYTPAVAAMETENSTLHSDHPDTATAKIHETIFVNPDEQYGIDVYDENCLLSQIEDDSSIETTIGTTCPTPNGRNSIASVKSSDSTCDLIGESLRLQEPKQVTTVNNQDRDRDVQCKPSHTQNRPNLQHNIKDAELCTLLTDGYDNLQGVFYVKQHLSCLLPHLTYKLQNKYTDQLQLKNTSKLAEVIFNNLQTNEATDAVASALDEEEKLPPKVLESAIKEIVKEELSKLTFAKNFNGGPKSQRSPPKPHGPKTTFKTPPSSKSLLALKIRLSPTYDTTRP